MLDDAAQGRTSESGGPERALLALALALATALLVAEVFFLDLNQEEPRRLIVAQAQLERPSALATILDEPYLKKPPGYNWLLALTGAPFGAVTKVSARLTSLAVWALLGLLLWRAGAGRLSPGERRTWVAGFLLCGVVALEKAALAEIDLFLTLLLTAAGLVWLRLVERGRPDLAWFLAQLLVGLSVLTKGPVGYPFFYVPTIGYLLWERRLRGPSDRPSFGWGGFLLGLVAAHGLVGLWFWALTREVPLDQLLATYQNETAGRVSGESKLGKVAERLVTAPFQLLASLFPFSLAVLALFCDRGLRQRYARRLVHEPLLRFCLLGLPCLLLILVPGFRVRYLLPLFPFVAALLAALVHEVPPGLGARATLWLCRGGGLLALVAASLPWLMQREDSALPAWAQLSASVATALAGLLLLALARPARWSWGRGLAAALLLMVVVKAVHLFVYLPQIKPERVLFHDYCERLALDLKARGIDEVVIDRSSFLVLPWYLPRYGVRVRGQDSVRPGDWVITHDAYGGPSRELKLPGHHVHLLYREPLRLEALETE